MSLLKQIHMGIWKPKSRQSGWENLAGNLVGMVETLVNLWDMYMICTYI